MPQHYRRAPARRGRRPINYSKTKKLVTGHGPTMLERIATGAGSAARLARAVAPVVAAINTEMKYFDQTGTGNFFLPGTNDVIVNLTGGIAQGTTDITRIGNSILAKDIAIKMYILWLASTNLVQSIGRLTLLCWKEDAQDNPPTITKIFEAPANLLSAFNKDYTDQFVVIKDKLIAFQALASPSALNQSPHTLKIYKRLGYHLRFDAGTTADHTVNHLFLIFRCNAATSANQASFEYYSRLNFSDN